MVTFVNLLVIRLEKQGTECTSIISSLNKNLWEALETTS